MDKILKLRAVCEFLGQESGLSGSNGPESEFFRKKYKHVSKVLAQYDNAPPADKESTKDKIDDLLRKHSTWNSVAVSGYVAEIGDSLLFKLSSIALGSSEAAGYACYRLGDLYDDIYCAKLKSFDVSESYVCAAYFYGKALEKGYCTKEVKKAYAQACTHLGWYDTALYWYPEDTQEITLVRAYLNHHIRFCKERGLTFPKTKDHIVIFEESRQAKNLADEIVRRSDAVGYLRSKLNALEYKLPLQITELTYLLDHKKLELKKRRKRARRFWWLLFLLITLCAIPGWYSGDGDGFQGFSYKLAMMIYTPLRNVHTKGLSMAERMAAFAEEDFRGGVAGCGVPIHAAITLLWTIVQSLSFEKKQAPKYDKFKKKLYEDNGLEEIVSEIERIRLPGEETESDGAQAPNVIAQAWHQALIESAPVFNIPSVYGEKADPEYRRKEEWWMDDYDAFVNALRMFSNRNVMLWSGNEVADLYRLSKYEKNGEYQDYLELYFKVMFKEAMLVNEYEDRGIWMLEKQYKKLEKEIWHKEWEEKRRYESENEERASSTSSGSNGSDGSILDDLERGLNAWSFGVAGTNKEIIDGLYQEGKISWYEAERAKDGNWRPSDLFDDND